MIETELAEYLREYQPPDRLPGTAHGYFRDNNMYGHLDGEVLYAMVRHQQPHQIVEVGAGHSTLVIRDALARNATACDHQVFDPYPAECLSGVVGEVAVQRVGANDIPMERFAALRDGDILFVDTTHTVKPHGDVVRLVLEVMPMLSDGVIVHIHDFFRPYEYPRFLIEQFGIHWQEQYLVQAFLAHNADFEVLLANHALIRAHRARVEAVVQRLPPTAPGSALWLRRRSARDG